MVDVKELTEQDIEEFGTFARLALATRAALRVLELMPPLNGTRADAQLVGLTVAAIGGQDRADAAVTARAYRDEFRQLLSRVELESYQDLMYSQALASATMALLLTARITSYSRPALAEEAVRASAHAASSAFAGANSGLGPVAELEAYATVQAAALTDYRWLVENAKDGPVPDSFFEMNIWPGGQRPAWWAASIDSCNAWFTRQTTGG